MDVILIFQLVVLIMSVVIHELSHGYVAYYMGDSTAKNEGRLTLNPFSHLDLFGSILLPALLFLMGSPALFGWAKPVPINPYNFKNRSLGEVLVSMAGPASNFLIALIFGLILRFTPENFLIDLNGYPSGIFIALVSIVSINLWIFIFNLIPLPPLDGSWILFYFMPASLDFVKDFLRRYGVVILVFLILFSDVFWSKLVTSVFNIITGRMLT